MLEAYGGKRALAMRLLHSVRVPLFGYQRFLMPTATPIRRLVFVCAGNICRSPFGEQVARQRGADSVSMGLLATIGSPPHPPAVAAANDRGFDSAQHRATPFEPEAIHASDLVLAFELRHALLLESALTGRGAYVRLLGAYAGATNCHIHDPYGLSSDYFARCFEIIERGVDVLLTQVRLQQVGTHSANSDS